MTPVAEQRAIELIEADRRERPEVVQLAQAASLAVRVEPHLLRRLRIELCPDIDVGAEADLWFSDLVETIGPRFIVLDPHVVAVLRQSLRERPELLERIDRVLREEHAESPPSLRLEERLNYLAIKGAGSQRADLDEALRPALRTIAAGGDDARNLAQWALRALPRLFPGALDCDNGVALTMAASAVLGQRRIVEQVPETDVPIETVAWALPTDASTATTAIWMTLVADGVRIDDTGPTDQAIAVPATTPLLLELSWTAVDGIRLSTLVQAEAGRTVELGPGVTDVAIRTLAGDEYLLSAVKAATARSAPTDAAPPEAAAPEAVAPDAEQDAAIWAKRVAIVVGVDVDDVRLFPPLQSNWHNAGAVQERLNSLGYRTHTAAASAQLDQRDELRQILEELPAQAEVLWLHIVAPGKMMYGQALRLGGLHSIGLADAESRLDWMPVDELISDLSFWFDGNVLLTIEVTASIEADPDDAPPSDERELDRGAVFVGITNGGAWEDDGPLTHLVLDALPTELGPEPQVPLDDLIEHVRDGWNRWADNNDYERDTLTLAVAADRFPPLVGTADEAWSAPTAGGLPLGAPELPPDLPPIVDLRMFDKLVETSAGSDVDWFRAGLERATTVGFVRRPGGQQVGTGFLVRAADLTTTLPPDELVVLTTGGVVARAQYDDPTLESPVGDAASTPLVIDFLASGDEQRQRRNATIVWNSDIVDAALLRLESPVEGAIVMPVAAHLPVPDGEERVYLIGDLVGEGLQVALGDNELLDVEAPRIHYRVRVDPTGEGSPVFDSGWNLIAMHTASDESMPRPKGVEGVHPASQGITIGAIRQRFEQDFADEFGEQDDDEYQAAYESEASFADTTAPGAAASASLYDEDGNERTDFEPEILSERRSGRVGRTARRLWNRVTGGGDEIKIFVSYVRTDAEPWVGHIVDRLQRSFGDDAVFIDAESIVPSTSLSEQMEDAVRQADVVLAIFGPTWKPSAWMTSELEFALQDARPIIPVLVGGAQFPTGEELPPDIVEISTRQAVQVGDARFERDMDTLERAIRGTTAGDRRS